VVADDDIDLFDGRRQAVAYIASDADLTIYLWSGKPVAYFLEGEDIYGFNGKHLGWFLHGVVYDPDGHIVAAVPEAFKSPVAPPPFKAFKQFRPFKAFKEFKPFRPFLSKTWSSMLAKVFFLQGAS